MTVLRITKKQNNFVILDKTCIGDEGLSWAAKGLHTYLMSLPDNWQIKVRDLQNRATNGRDSVRGILAELEQKGYIQKASVRKEDNGQFGGVEYTVSEISILKNEPNPPRPGNPSAVDLARYSPGPGNPSPANPASEKATLINNNIINNNINNKTAAKNIDSSIGQNSKPKDNKAAAVIFSNLVNFSSEEDLVIGSNLTACQKNKVASLVTQLNIFPKEKLIAEIEFCLLNPKHFTGCGKDFSKKLNAIRAVILRGDWQTPVGMAAESLESKQEDNTALKSLYRELDETQSELLHFTKLLTSAKENTRTHFETIIAKTQNKIKALESKINLSLNPSLVLKDTANIAC